MNTVESVADDVIDCAAVLDRFEGDVALLREVAELFLEDCPGRMAAIREAMRQGDAKALQLAAHSLKGSVSNFAARAAVAAALRLETIARAGDLTDAGKVYTQLEREVARVVPLIAQLGRSGSDNGDAARTP